MWHSIGGLKTSIEKKSVLVGLCAWWPVPAPGKLGLDSVKAVGGKYCDCE